MSAAQLAEIAVEGTGAESAAELLVMVDAALAQYEALVRELRPEEFGGIREIGRKRLETRRWAWQFILRNTVSGIRGSWFRRRS